jgi:thiamine biosynthesis protein ThiS
MRITVNGKPRELDGPCTLAEFLQQHEVNPVLVAIEHNGEIVPRDSYANLTLAEGDVMEIVHMVGGG